MSKEGFSEPVSHSRALMEIEAIKQQQFVKGAVDSEPAAFKTIREDLELRKITPEEAIRRAQGVADGRQDYH